MRRRFRMVVAVGIAAALVATACGGDDEGGDGAPGGTAATTTAAKQPVAGGTLTFGSYSKIQGLDPIVGLGHGTSGGIPMLAVYDSLMRFNVDTKKYEPQTAESLTSNDTSTEWTLKLKPNVTFSDGTPHNAEAVRFGINRHRVGGGIPPAQCAEWVACPRNATSSANYVSLIKDLTVVDPLTLKFTLTDPWTSFPYLLASEAGFIPSPTALKAACTDATKPVNQCAFNLNPVGAGPFKVQSYKPDDVIDMVRNDKYWNGAVYLDGIKFLDSGDTGGLKTLDSFNAGTTQAAMLRDPAAVASAKDAKIPGFTYPNMGGAILLINMGANVNCAGGNPAPLCTGKPDGPTPSQPATRELKVRQAIAAAIDPKAISTRAYGGKAKAGTQLFTSEFPWDPKVPGHTYDVEAAKKLVSEAKTTGWNGTVRLLAVGSPTGRDVMQTVQAQLQAAGFVVQLEEKESTAQQQAVIITKDFEVTSWGIATGVDDANLFSFVQNFKSDVSSNRVGFKSAAVDKALVDIRQARTDAEKVAGYKVIAEEIKALVPVIPTAQIDEYMIHSPKLNGVKFGGRAYMFFDKAWFEK